MTTHIAKCALEYWRASGERTKERLENLVTHFATTNCETDYLEFHVKSAMENVKPWEMQK